MSDMDWLDRGACRGMSVDLMFPSEKTGSAAAKRVCASCSEREPCLTYALGHGDLEGVWGGTSEAERRKLLRLRRRAAQVRPAAEAAPGR